jgi:hypothetical protein
MTRVSASTNNVVKGTLNEIGEPDDRKVGPLISGSPTSLSR